MPAPSEKRGRALYWVPLVVLTTGLGFALGALCVHFYTRSSDTADSGSSSEAGQALDKVVALGRIEPRDGILSLGVPAPDRISRIKVKEGESVKKGQSLAVLDSEVMRELER